MIETDQDPEPAEYSRIMIREAWIWKGRAGPGNRNRPGTAKKYNQKAGSSIEKKGALFELIDRVGLQLGLQSPGSRINSNIMVRILLAQRNFKDFCRGPSRELQKSFFWSRWLFAPSVFFIETARKTPADHSRPRDTSAS